MGLVRSFQISAVFPHLTVLENVRIALQRKGGHSFDFWRSDRSLTSLDARALVARVAPVTLDRVSIGDITVRNVPASVSERGMLATTLLGMSFLKRLTRVDMRGETLILQE